MLLSDTPSMKSFYRKHTLGQYIHQFVDTHQFAGTIGARVKRPLIKRIHYL